MSLALDSATRLLLPSGYDLGDSFSAQGAIVAVAAAAGVASAPQVLLSRYMPPGALVYIQSLSIRVIDLAAYDQLFFALKRNGAVLYPWNDINGEQVMEDSIVPVDEAFDPGLLELVAKNISGTTETGASLDPVAIRVITRFRGYLLKPRLYG
jgi:hypothetical protein